MKYYDTLIQRHFTSTIRKRGKRYFKLELVNDVELDKNIVSASVSGTSEYDIWIEFTENFKIAEMHCECPYYERDNCKHLAALLYYLDDRGFFPSANTNAKNVSLPKNNAYNNSKQRKQILQLKDKFSSGQNNLYEVKNGGGKIQYEFAYAIEASGTRTKISLVRKRLKKDGSFGNISSAYSINFNNVQDIDLYEKLIVNYLSTHNNSFFLGYSTLRTEEINQRIMFNDILKFISEREVYWEKGYNNFFPVDVLSEPAESKLFIDEESSAIVLKLQIEIDGKQLSEYKDIKAVLDSPLWVWMDAKVFQLKNINYEQFDFFKENNFKIVLDKNYLSLFEKELLPKIAASVPIYSDKYEIKTLNVTPTKKIFFEEVDGVLLLKLKFGYGETDVDYNPNEENIPLLESNKIVLYKRDKEFEEEANEKLKEFYVKKISDGVYSPRIDPIDFLLKNFKIFEELEFELLGLAELKKLKINTAKPKVAFNVSSGIDWFDLQTNISFNGTTVPFSELLSFLKEKKKYIQLSDGSAGALPDKWIKKLKQSLAFGEVEGENIRFSNFQALGLEMLLNESDEAALDDEFKARVDKFKSFEKIEEKKTPQKLNGKLRHYQKAGFDWFYFLQKYSFGGILADDMGLGKTIQAITLLLKEKASKGKKLSLIVAPSSVVFNWIDELGKFAPTLKALNHTGIERVKNNNGAFKKYDVIVTSYAVLLRDISFLKDAKFHYAILDESQKIKNPHSKTGKAARLLKSKHKLCLTGTPIENNLTELWSQMTFLNPGLFGSFKKFNETFVKDIAKNNDRNTLELLKRTIHPFILRRTKEVVAKELPKKIETVHYCEMDKDQEKVYKYFKDSIRTEIMREIEKNGIQKSGFKILEGLLRLRQICNHPVLVDSNYTKHSSKFEEMKTMIESVIAEGHKVLIFSQFVQMLDIVKTYLDKEKIGYEYLTGSVRNREKRIKNFKNNDDVKIFLISLKAGGFGLNLTEADYVFLYDPWWNPAVEMQASDRAHRIGQKNNVFVYKMITKNSIEEKILHLQAKKKKLVSDIISSEASVFKNLTKNDIQVLFE